MICLPALSLLKFGSSTSLLNYFSSPLTCGLSASSFASFNLSSIYQKHGNPGITQNNSGTLPYRRTPINICRRNDGNRKSPFEPHCSSRSRQDPRVSAKIHGQKIKEKLDVRMVAKNVLPKYLIITKGK